MNRATRTLIVVAIAVLFAAVATYYVYVAIKSRPVREVEVAHTFAVVAARPLPLGTQLAPGDLKVVPWPAASLVPGGFSTVDEAVGRGLVSAVAENEPLNSRNVASKEAGAGLPPTIPAGMRAISVKVNEVIGVAGFVVPGTRVDVMVILREGTGSLARVVVSNVLVLAAGTKYDQDVAREGQAMPSSVVTLMVSPEDAALVGLAASEGQIMLTLRNPLDVATSTSDVRGVRTSNLRGDSAPPPDPNKAPVTKRVVVAPAPPPPAPPPPKIYTVETIRAAKRTEEIVK